MPPLARPRPTVRRRVVRSTILIVLGVGLVLGTRVLLDSAHDQGRPLRWTDLAANLGMATHIPGINTSVVVQGLLDRGYHQRRAGLHLAVLEWGADTVCRVTLDGEGSRLTQVEALITGPDQDTWGKALAVQVADVCLGQEGYEWARDCWEEGGQIVQGQARATLVRAEGLTTLTIVRD